MKVLIENKNKTYTELADLEVLIPRYDVFINGILQSPSSYKIAGNNLILKRNITPTPVETDEIIIIKR